MEAAVDNSLGQRPSAHDPAHRSARATEPGRKPRRPRVRRTSELEQEILERIAAGESLRQVCGAKGMPDPATVRYWAVTDPAFGERFRIARIVQAHEYVDRIKEELDRPLLETGHAKQVRAEIQLRKLRIDSWKWVLSRMLPKLYGGVVDTRSSQSAPLRGMTEAEAIQEIISLLRVANER